MQEIKRPINDAHKRWAASHDWFVCNLLTGVRVRSVVYDAATGETITEEVNFYCYIALRNWAGY